MKHVLLICALLPIFSMAQTTGNGGQYAENALGKMNYAGHANGEYIISRTNLQACSVEIKVDWLDKDTSITIAGNSQTIIRLPGQFVAHTIIKSRPLDRCGSNEGDMGWLEICSPDILPLKFNYFRGSVISPTKIKLELSVTGTEDEGKFNLQASFDGKTFETITVLLPYDGEYTLFVEKAKKPDGTVYFITSFK